MNATVNPENIHPPTNKAKLNLVVAKAISDPEFLKQLQTNTHKILEEHGLIVPPDVKVHVIVEGKVDGKLDKYLVIPAVTSNLDNVAGGQSLEDMFIGDYITKA